MNVHTLIVEHGLPLMAALILLGELGVPTGVPMELAIIVTGALAIHSPQELMLGILLLTIADLIGTTSLHLVARYGSGTLMKRFTKPDGKAQRMLDRLHRFVGGRDLPLVLVGRSLPFARMWVTLGTAVTRIRLRRFLIGATGGGLIWVSVPLMTGYFFRASISRFEAEYAAVADWALLFMPMLVLLGVVVWWIRRGDSLTSQLHRGRAALALGAGLVSAGFVGYRVYTEGWLPEQDTLKNALTAIAAMPEWAPLLGCLALLLIIVAFADLWSTRFVRYVDKGSSQMLLWEATATASTLSLIVLAGLLVTLVANQNPLTWL